MTTVCVSVVAVVSAECPRCGKRLEEKLSLDEESLSTGNTTQQAVYHVYAAKRTVEARKKARGWTDICGACGDTEGAELRAR